MGVSPQQFFVLKNMVLGNKEKCCNKSSTLAEAQTKRRLKQSRRVTAAGINGGRGCRCKRPTKMKWRTRRPSNGIERRVRTLKKLIPKTESTGLDGLFRETADYILSLQMRVRVMQSMVKALSSGSDE